MRGRTSQNRLDYKNTLKRRWKSKTERWTFLGHAKPFRDDGKSFERVVEIFAKFIELNQRGNFSQVSQVHGLMFGRNDLFANGD